MNTIQLINEYKKIDFEDKFDASIFYKILYGCFVFISFIASMVLAATLLNIPTIKSMFVVDSKFSNLLVLLWLFGSTYFIHCILNKYLKIPSLIFRLATKSKFRQVYIEHVLRNEIYQHPLKMLIDKPGFELSLIQKSSDVDLLTDIIKENDGMPCSLILGYIRSHHIIGKYNKEMAIKRNQEIQKQIADEEIKKVMQQEKTYTGKMFDFVDKL